MRLLACSTLALALLALGARPVHSQAVLQGTLRGEQDRFPIAGAEVEAVDSTGYRRARTVTDSLGHFTLRVPTGHYRLQVHPLGYAATTSDPIPLVSGEYTTIDLLVPVAPVPLAPLSVTPRAGPAMLEGFRARAARGNGVYLLRADLVRQTGVRLTDVLAAAAGMDAARGTRPGTRTLRLRRAAGNAPCPVQLFVDGHRVAGEVDLDAYEPADLEGAEIYNGLADAPAEFGGIDARCGVVALWTRRPAADPTPSDPPGPQVRASRALEYRFLGVIGLAAIFLLLNH